MHLGLRHFSVRVGTHYRHLGVYRLLWPRGGPGAAHVEESGIVHRGAPCLHTVVRGTPDSGYRQYGLVYIKID